MLRMTTQEALRRLTEADHQATKVVLDAAKKLNAATRELDYAPTDVERIEKVKRCVAEFDEVALRLRDWRRTMIGLDFSEATGTVLAMAPITAENEVRE